MRQRMILIASIGVNLALVVALFVLSRGSSSKTNQPEAALTPTGDSTNGKPRVVLRRQFFSWDELESPDYAAYIKNLRDIACPESTIRDIITADVNQLYAKKRQNEVQTSEQQWWRADPDPAVNPAAAAKYKALDLERRELLAKLLGPDWDANNPANQPARLVTLNGPVLGDLSPDAKKAVQDIALRSQKRTADYQAALQASGNPSDPAELAKIRQETRNDLAKVLSPAQLEEFLLRYSQNATSLRNEMRGVNLSPDEFRNLFRATDALDQQLSAIAGDDATSQQQRNQLQQQRELALQTVLGADRYKSLQIANDTAYNEAVASVQQAGAPTNTIRAIYQINQATAQEQNRIFNDPTIPDPEREALLAEVAQAQRQVSDQVLGLAPGTSISPPLPPGLAPSQIHAFQAGETIDQIASQYGTTTPAILSANPELNPNVIQRGQNIIIPSPPPLPPAQ